MHCWGFSCKDNEIDLSYIRFRYCSPKMKHGVNTRDKAVPFLPGSDIQEGLNSAIFYVDFPSTVFIKSITSLSVKVNGLKILFVNDSFSL